VQTLTLSLAKLYAKQYTKATQRRRLHALELLERDRRQMRPRLFDLAYGLLPMLQNART
jgi:hypothetical protein